MKKWLRNLTLGCAAIPLAQCTILPIGSPAHAAEATAAPAPVAAAATVDADPALWVVKDDDTTIYLFGTVHVLKPGLSWFDEAVKDAFDKSDELMLEVVLPEDQGEMMGTMMPLAIDQTGTKLSTRLGDTERAAYEKAMAGLGLPVAQFDNFEPWFVGMTLSVLPLTKAGYDPEQGSEKQLTGFAKAAGKPIVGLETITQQLGFFDGLPMPSQVGFLNAIVADLDSLGATLDTLVAQWSQGDPDALAETMNGTFGTSPELAKVLLYDRNANWADQLQARMDKPGTVFVAVGAGHLAGPKSVQDYLQERGLTVSRVDY